MMIRLLFLSFFTLVNFYFVKAQNSLYSGNYLWNYASINPAALGSENALDIKMNYRRQWSGIEGAPNSFSFLAQSPLYQNQTEVLSPTYHATGIEAYYNEAGLWSETAVYARYAYHLTLSQRDEWNADSRLRMSFGASFGLKTIGFDASKATLHNPNDAAIQNNQQSTIPDANIGVWLRNDRFFGGFGVYQLFENNVNIGQSNNLERYYNLTAGGNIHLSENIVLSPSVLMNINKTTDISWDMNTKIAYNDLIWTAINYRHKRAVQTFLGTRITSWLDIAYSYEFSTFINNNENNFNLLGTTNEVLLGIRLFNKSSNSDNKRNSIF
ncbi:Bacteroidetes-specific putative membrane protein [Bernardetia litoralis DSM 6794]|uniref:Bacteroidetes-specific putative membrane protein n=1 Tax=Bernardetia litoralis (strain ATCC 23117 / DSM 6794 / NBRC 15988 / NCIMB 1366 / Fx l1 / Sio-4) TaxID=880071 RepID=I4ALN2_BERLS|nr:type IX secretion system membrane protein PorP/SprF [Bernardetia litoralis]AFM04867.1 Bacteroidetes-specific putative membrane protein [Bernardetia litoralis DSM 6794]